MSFWFAARSRSRLTSDSKAEPAKRFMLPSGAEAAIREAWPWRNACWKIITITHPSPTFQIRRQSKPHAERTPRNPLQPRPIFVPLEVQSDATFISVHRRQIVLLKFRQEKTGISRR